METSFKLNQGRLQDVTYSLSCDPGCSVIANAIPKALLNVFGTEDLDVLACQGSLRLGSSLSVCSADYAERLNDAYSQVVGPKTKEVVLVRIHGLKTSQLMLDEFKGWLAKFEPKACINYWDAFDPNLEPGQERFTVLAAV